MLFVPLGSFIEGMDLAEQANQRDFENAIKNDRAIQGNIEFFAGAPGRVAGQSLESQRVVSATNFLQPQVSTLGRSTANSILGNAATRSLKGVFDQQVAGFTMPQIKTIAQDTANTRANQARNQFVNQGVLVPQQQAISSAQNVADLSLIPQQTDTNRARLQHSELISRQGIDQRKFNQEELIPLQRNAQLNELEIANVQSELVKLQILPDNSSPEQQMAQAASTTEQLRNSGLIAPGDSIIKDPQQGWSIISTVNGKRQVVPLSQVADNIKSLKATKGTGTTGNTRKPTKFVTKPLFDEKGQPILDAQGNQMFTQTITSFDEPYTPPRATNVQQPDLVPQQGASGVDIIGNSNFVMSPQEVEALRQQRAATVQNQPVSQNIVAPSPPEITSNKVNYDALRNNPLVVSQARTELLREFPNISGEELVNKLSAKINELIGQKQ